MSRQIRSIWLVLAAAHLFVVTLGAFGVRLRHVGPIGHTLHHYGILSGAASGYGFFAGGGTGLHVLHFDVTHDDGRRTTQSIATGSSHEADHRVAHIAGNFTEPDPQLRRKLAASLAAQIFARFPDAAEVTLRVEHFESVSMNEFQSGKVPQVVPFYQAKFKRKGPPTEVQSHAFTHAG